ncbi:hypothetical protein N0V82_008296 [Gnomoniopsis sp. IMI 355080]|nr:hypothetical protein N0V82_008296 [Gnomoniopsis sp. IMI 355080]
MSAVQQASDERYAKATEASQVAADMKPKMSAQQAREERYAKAQVAKDKLKELQSNGPKAKRFEELKKKERAHNRKKAEEWRKKMLNESKSIGPRSAAETPVPSYVRRRLTDSPAQKKYKIQHGKVESKKNDRDQDPTHLQTTPNTEPAPNDSSSTDHLNKSAVQVDSPITGPSSNNDNLLCSPLDANKSPLLTERSTLERPNSVPVPFPTLSPHLPTFERINHLPTLQNDETSIYTGRSSNGVPSSESNELAPSDTENLVQLPTNQEAKPTTQSLKTVSSLAAVDQQHSEGAEGIKIKSDALKDEKMKPLQDLKVGYNGKDDSAASSASATPMPAVASPANIPIERDTSFSTRPSRKAAREAAVAIAGSRRKGKGRGRGGGSGGAAAPAPPPTSSAPPPPPPPPPGRSSRGSGGAASSHNKTWGFTTGPDGPWIEPPVIDDPMFTKPSLRKNLKKPVKEAIAHLEEKEPVYDPHAPQRVKNQETMYKLRVRGAMGQWPTSNTRGAVDWEENQKRRLGVAVREAMRKAEEEEKAEEMEEQRKAKMKQTAGNENNNGEGASSSEHQAKTRYTSDEEGSVTTKVDLIMDDVEDKSDDDEDATLVGEHSDAEDANPVQDANLHKNPRAYNGKVAQRPTAHRKGRIIGPRMPGTLHAGNIGTTDDTDQESNEPRRRSGVPFSFRADSNLLHAAERDEPSLMSPNTDTIASSDPVSASGDDGGGPLRVHNFDYRNLVASGQIGGAADNRVARPAPSPYVFGGGAEGQAPPDISQEQPNARLMDLMERHLGLQLESPPPAGEAFPPLTGGDWSQFPTGSMDVNVNPLEGGRGRPSGSGQHRQPPRSQ